MEVDKQLKFKSHQRMQVEFISNNVDVMTHDCLSSVALALEASRFNLQEDSICNLQVVSGHPQARMWNDPHYCV